MLDAITLDPEKILSFSIAIGAAALSGLIVGIEREYKGKSAGIKTNMLVALGAAVFVWISVQFQGEDNMDITRVLSQVVTGIGFLGAGVILQKEDKVKGLTTAATIWCSAAAGCMAAFKLLVELGILTVLVVIINAIFGIIDSKINPENS